MIPFSIPRYLKRFAPLVICMTLAGMLLTGWYVEQRQQYTAFAVIRYASPGIADGLAPDGTPLDVSEIYSPAVLTNALQTLGSNAEPGMLRAGFTVEPLLTNEQRQINEARNAQGRPGTCRPDTYRVQLVLDGAFGAEQTRTLLEAVLQSYCAAYTAAHDPLLLPPCPAQDLLENNFSPSQCLQIMTADAAETMEYLQTAQTRWPEFRSLQTGYTFEDLHELYADLAQQLLALQSANAPDSDALRQQCQTYEAALTHCYTLVHTCSQEAAQQASAKNLERVSSVQVQPALQPVLYLALALILFFACGCGAAILLGRAAEIAAALHTAPESETSAP